MERGGDTGTRSDKADRLPAWRPVLALCLAVCLGWGQAAPAGSPLADVNNTGPLFINEVLAVNATGLRDPQGDFDDWIEIYNASSRPVNLAGMYLTDDLSNPTQWQVPSGGAATTTVAGKGYLLIWADGDMAASGLHAGFSLSSKGEEVGLFDANGMLVDAFAFGPQTADVSFGRSPDGGPDLRFLGDPTPGAKNGTPYLGVVEDPTFSRCRGFYDARLAVTVGCPTPGATILYTTDGADPQHAISRISTARVYSSPLWMDKTTCLRAVATLNGWKSSRVITHTYVLGAPAALKSLPLISLVADAGQTFYEPNGVAANPTNLDLERPVSFECIQPADNSGLQVDCGLRVHGSEYLRPRYVRGDKFSFRVCFRSRYGPSELDYPLFPFEVQQFGSVVLRAGHNDMVNPFIKDELVRRLFKDMGHVSCGGTFANLFINGQYKGYYNPTEHIDESFCQAWFDSSQPWDVMTMSGIRDGDRVRWDAFIGFVRQHNLADNTHYGTVLSQLDIEDFVDYLILRLWTGDWDWPQNNWAAASERSPQGMWRFFVWDAEGSFFSDRLQTVYLSELNSQSNEHGYLYRSLKANRQFRQLFANRLYKHFTNGGALTPQNVVKRFDELRTQMAGVLPGMDAYVINTWVPQRPAIFFTACTQEGLYTFAGPSFSVNGKPQHGGYAQPGDSLTLTASEPNGIIYYTLDGGDPAERLLASGFGQVDLVTRGSTKRILVPTQAIDVSWRGARPFDDSSWPASSGDPGGVGFNRDFLTQMSMNVAPLMNGVNATCLVRIPFTFSVDRKAVAALTLKVQSDAGFIAYLNGMEVARYNFTGQPTWNSNAAQETSNAVAVTFRPFDISAWRGSLRTGQNILALQGMNSSAADNDFLINAALTADLTAVDPPAGLIGYTGPLRLDHSVVVKALVAKPTSFSAISEVTFAVGPVAQTLRVSEVMYHPQETGDPNDPNAEYIELTNVGSQTINLSRVRFTDGVDFTFPDMDLMPGHYVLVVKDPTTFRRRYGPGAVIAGRYQGTLSNRGSRMTLQDALGGVIEQFEYADAWYPITAGKGFSLTVSNPSAADPNALSDQGRWRPSESIGGSPGWDDSGESP